MSMQAMGQSGAAAGGGASAVQPAAPEPYMSLAAVLTTTVQAGGQPAQDPSGDFMADRSRAGGPLGAAGFRPNNWSDDQQAPMAAEAAAVAGELQRAPHLLALS